MHFSGYTREFIFVSLDILTNPAHFWYTAFYARHHGIAVTVSRTIWFYASIRLLYNRRGDVMCIVLNMRGSEKKVMQTLIELCTIVAEYWVDMIGIVLQLTR